MRIKSQEVKTIYNISVSSEDFEKAKSRWVKDEVLRITYPKAFTNQNTGHMQCIDEMKKHINAHGQQAGLLAEVLGFDGWVNAGIFNEKTYTIEMTVYNYGDMINQ